MLAFDTGYDYLSAGRNVVRLFKQRGWTTYIADRLVFRVLFLANIGVATLTGLVCLCASWIMMGTEDAVSLHIAFWVSFIIGLLVSQTILFVVESATRTTMVLFAESATELIEVQDGNNDEKDLCVLIHEKVTTDNSRFPQNTLNSGTSVEPNSLNLT